MPEPPGLRNVPRRGSRIHLPRRLSVTGVVNGSWRPHTRNPLARAAVPPRSGVQSKPLIATCDNVVALLPVHVEAAGIGHKDALLAGHVGAEVPRRATLLRANASFDLGGDMVYPLILSLFGSLNAAIPAVAQIHKAIGDPLDMLLD